MVAAALDGWRRAAATRAANRRTATTAAFLRYRFCWSVCRLVVGYAVWSVATLIW